MTAHYALLVTAASNLETAILGPGLGLGPWATIEDAGIALVVVRLPLTSDPPPSLPNPVRPDLSDIDIKPRSDMNLDQVHVLASYGLFPRYFATLTGRPAVSYPVRENDCDAFDIQLVREFQNQGVLPYDPQVRPDYILFKNGHMGRAIRSSTTRHTVNRRTQFSTVGPALHLAPSQWGLTEIWKTGGLVTFSPTFILRNPDKFSGIMTNIRTAPNWAAYVIPEVVQWLETSWKITT